MSERYETKPTEPPVKAGFEEPKPAPVSTPPPAPVATAPQVQHTPQGFFIPQDQFEQMLRRIAEAIKAPSATEQVKLDKQEARDKVTRLRAAQDAIELVNIKRREQRFCNHVNPDGNSRWRGQVLSNGWGKICCAWCQKSYYIVASAEMARNGLGLGEPQSKTVTEAQIEKWSRESLDYARANRMKLPVEDAQFWPDVSDLPMPTESRPRA